MTLPIDDNKKPDADRDVQVQIPAGGITLKGCQYLPAQAKTLVILANNDDSERSSVRDRYITEVLHLHQIGTLFINLLTPEEEQSDDTIRELHFDTLMLAGRLDRIVEWARTQLILQDINLGYFCSSTCGGAALVAAAQHPGYIAAVVCHGGRPDLAGSFLPKVKAPTLLLVGENDELVIELNRRSITQLNKQSKLVIIPNAAHLFEEPGSLEEMVRQAVSWFVEHSSSALETGQNNSSRA